MKRFAYLLHYPKYRFINIYKEPSMAIEQTTVPRDATDNRRVIGKRSPIGSWEIYSWGDGKFSGMAAVSAITALQIGATLAPLPADKIALNKAVEYLMDTLASQLRSFQQAIR
jgi:hypothetical protein